MTDFNIVDIAPKDFKAQIGKPQPQIEEHLNCFSASTLQSINLGLKLRKLLPRDIISITWRESWFVVFYRDFQKEPKEENE